jgi:SAM-dependent methyltransferase
LTEEEQAQLLALPYLAGTVPATSTTGVTVHDTGAAFEGVNLYVSGHGFEAILMSMDGRVLHRWALPLEDVFPGADTDRGRLFWRRARLLDNGDLLAVYERTGVVRIDAGSRPIWVHRGDIHHDIDLDERGNVYVLGGRNRSNPWLSGPPIIFDDLITILDPAGSLVDELSVYECFDRSDYSAILTFMGTHPDIFHTNTIAVLDGSQEHRSPHFAKGNLLISVRNLNTVAIVDPSARKVVWAMAGMWIRQHEPVLLDSGRMLLFDNNVGYGRSRVIEFDPFTHEVFWKYDGSEEQPLNTLFGGVSQRLPNGNTLIVESDQGRALEVSPAGERKLEITQSRMTPRSLVLDVGCGTGSLVLRLAPYAARVHGLDLSSEMIRIARSKTSEQEVDNVTFHVGPFDDSFTVLEEGSLDGICAFSLLHLIEDRLVALERIYRLLRPGGFFVSSTVCLGDRWLPYGPLLWVMRKLGKAPVVRHFSRATLEADLLRAGFTDLAAPDVGDKSRNAFVVAIKPDGAS